MFDRLENVNFVQFILIVSAMVIFFVQLLLCFKVKNLIIRLLPAIFLTTLAGIFLLIALSSPEWEGLTYAIYAFFSSSMILVCGAGWLLWAIVSFCKKRRIE